MNEPMKCECCGVGFVFQWSDTHGVGVCSNCGLPYTTYHYEGGNRVERPPAVALTGEGLVLAKRYWTEHQRRVFPACFDIGISGRLGASYSGATPDDCSAFKAWFKAQPEVTASRENAGG